jgi:hypothetical protein
MAHRKPKAVAELVKKAIDAVIAVSPMNRSEVWTILQDEAKRAEQEALYTTNALGQVGYDLRGSIYYELCDLLDCYRPSESHLAKAKQDAIALNRRTLYID